MPRGKRHSCGPRDAHRRRSSKLEDRAARRRGRVRAGRGCRAAQSGVVAVMAADRRARRRGALHREALRSARRRDSLQADAKHVQPAGMSRHTLSSSQESPWWSSERRSAAFLVENRKTSRVNAKGIAGHVVRAPLYAAPPRAIDKPVPASAFRRLLALVLHRGTGRAEPGLADEGRLDGRDLGGAVGEQDDDIVLGLAGRACDPTGRLGWARDGTARAQPPAAAMASRGSGRPSTAASIWVSACLQSPRWLEGCPAFSSGGPWLAPAGTWRSCASRSPARARSVARGVLGFFPATTRGQRLGKPLKLWPSRCQADPDTLGAMAE